MSSELQLPIDFERLPELRLLTRQLDLRARRVGAHGLQDPGNPPPHVGGYGANFSEVFASWMFTRLWVELGLLAQNTNRPGWLTPQGGSLYEMSLDAYFGAETSPIALLVEAGVLVVSEEGGWMCDRFARLNAHTAGNYKSKEIRGANSSALVRNAQNLARDAGAQAMLLPPERFHKKDGTRMNDTEIQRAMVVIKTLDNCLKLPGRLTSQYTEGLISDAADVVERFTADQVRSVYLWLMNNREHPARPSSTEKILAAFDHYEELA